MLQAQGVTVFAVQPRMSPRTHSDSLDVALHLQQQAGVETIATLTTWDKTIMTLQAELLGAHALGVRSVICTTGSPPVLGDYPAVDGIWEVDSLGLIALLAGLNAGRDSNGLALTTRTSFCVGARVNPGARDAEAEIARARAKVSAGAHFLVSRPVYDIDSLLRLVTALAVPEVPLLLSVAPLRSFEEADYLANEVPGVCIPPDTLRAMERAGRGAARAVGIELAADLLLAARKLVSGVIVTAAEDDPAGLAPLLAAAGPPVTSPVRRLSWTAAARRRFPPAPCDPNEARLAMSPRTSPPFRADHVGSLLRPQRLLQAREDFAAGRIPAADLRAVEDQEIPAAVRMQEEAGLQSATDGEFRRASWHMDFIYALGGISKAPGNMAVKFRNAAGEIEFTPASIRVDGKIRIDDTIFADAFTFLKSQVTTAVPKLTIPSPNMVHYRGGPASARPGGVTRIWRSSGRIWPRRTRMRWRGWGSWAVPTCSSMTPRWRT